MTQLETFTRTKNFSKRAFFPLLPNSENVNNFIYIIRIISSINSFSFLGLLQIHKGFGLQIWKIILPWTLLSLSIMMTESFRAAPEPEPGPKMGAFLLNFSALVKLYELGTMVDWVSPDGDVLTASSWPPWSGLRLPAAVKRPSGISEMGIILFTNWS